MKQKYKISSIIIAFICFVTSIYLIPSVKHWFYYRITDFIIHPTIPNKTFNNLKLENFIILDSRSLNEYNVSHIPNAIWIGEDSLFWDRLPKERDKPLLLYCSIGYRSSIVGKKIIDSLNLDVYNLKYGIFNYNYGHNPLVDSLGKQTNKVHPFSFLWGLFVE